MTLQDILKQAILKGASDIFIIAGLPVTCKVKGAQDRMGGEILKPAVIEPIIDEIYAAARRQKTILDKGLDDDFSFSVPELGRFRVNVFRQRGSLSAVIRVIKFGIPDYRELGMPESA